MITHDSDGEGYKNNQSDHVKCSIKSWWDWGEEEIKGKESFLSISTVTGKKEEKKKDVTVNEGDRNGPKLLQDHVK